MPGQVPDSNFPGAGVSFSSISCFTPGACPYQAPASMPLQDTHVAHPRSRQSCGGMLAHRVLLLPGASGPECAAE